VDLTPKQAALLQRLNALGFELVAFPIYPNHVGIRKGNCAALLAPVADSFEIAAAPSYVVNGNLSARITLDGREHFIWKKEKLEVTAARRNELAAFSSELADALLPVT
jgi:hypothetical protein